MSTGPAIAVAVVFVWLGMVLAISFLEAPLKFRAPNVTLQIGLGIGRLVFRALNTVEACFAIALVAIVVAVPTPARITVASSIAVAALAIQLIAVRPALTRRSLESKSSALNDRVRHSDNARLKRSIEVEAAYVVAGLNPEREKGYCAEPMEIRFVETCIFPAFRRIQIRDYRQRRFGQKREPTGPGRRVRKLRLRGLAESLQRYNHEYGRRNERDARQTAAGPVTRVPKSHGSDSCPPGTQQGGALIAAQEGCCGCGCRYQQKNSCREESGYGR